MPPPVGGLPEDSMNKAGGPGLGLVSGQSVVPGSREVSHTVPVHAWGPGHGVWTDGGHRGSASRGSSLTGPGGKRKVVFGRDPQPLAKDPSAPKPVPGAEGGCPGVPQSVEGSRRESGTGGRGKDRSPPHAASRRGGHSAAWDSPLRTWLSSGSSRPVGTSLPRGPEASPTTGTAPCSWRAPARPRWGRPTQYCLLQGWGPEVDTRSTVGRRGHT